MAGDIPPLSITVNLDTSGVKAGVEQATASIKNISVAAEETSSKFSNVKSVMLGTFASTEIQKGLSELQNFLKESVKAAEEAQTSIASLGTAMNDAKINTEENRATVENITQSMSNLGFTGNTTREALTKMVTATGSMTQAQKLMGVAADYARLKHMSLSTAATVLTRGTTGSMKAFREFGITLDSHLPKNQAITKAFNELNQKIGGQAAAYAETYAGKMEILSAKSEELKEKVGTALLPILTKLAGFFINSLDWLSKHKLALEAVATVIGGIVTVVVINLTKKLYEQAAAWLKANWQILAIVAAIALVAAGFIWAWNKFSGFRHAVVTGIEMIIDVISFLIRAVGVIAEAFANIVVGPIRMFLDALGFFSPEAKKMAESIGKVPKKIGDFFDHAAAKVESFKKTVESVKDTKINIKLPDFAKMLSTAGGIAVANPDITGNAQNKVSTATEKALVKRNATIKKLNDQAIKLEDQMNEVLKDRQIKMEKAYDTYLEKKAQAYADDNKRYLEITAKRDEAVKNAREDFDQTMKDATEAHETEVLRIKKEYADKAKQIVKDAADRQKSIIQQSIQMMTSAWQSATKIDLGDLFSKGAGSSILSTSTVNGITTSVFGAVKGTADALKAALQAKLDAIVKLQQNVGLLAAHGYNQAFIDEVISQGPEQGSALAEAILSASPETQASIQSLYGQISENSQTGMDALATQMNNGAHFATIAMMNEYNSIPAQLAESLAQNATNLQEALIEAQNVFDDLQAKATKKRDDAINAANTERDKALADAQTALLKNLADIQIAYDNSIKTISDATMKKLDALQAKLEKTAAALTALGASTASITTYEAQIHAAETAIAASTAQAAADLAATQSSQTQANGYNPSSNLYNRAVITGAITAPATTSTSSTPFQGIVGGTTYNYTVTATGLNMSDPNATAAAIQGLAAPIVITPSPAQIASAVSTHHGGF